MRDMFDRMRIKEQNNCRYAYHYACSVDPTHGGWYDVPLHKGGPLERTATIPLLQCFGHFTGVRCTGRMEFTGMRVEKEVGPRGEVLKDWRPLVSKLWKIRVGGTLVFHEEELDQMVDNGSIDYFGSGMDPDYVEESGDE